MGRRRQYPHQSKQDIIDVIQKLAKELGRSPSQADMRKAGVPWHRIYNLFGGMRPAVREAGLEPGPRGEALNEGAMILDWAAVVRKMRRLPSRGEYDRMGKHYSGTLHARLEWSQMAHRFVLMASEFHLQAEWEDVLAIVLKRYPLLGRSLASGDRVIGRSGDRQESAQPSASCTQQSARSIQPRNSVEPSQGLIHRGDAETRRTPERPEAGDPESENRAMNHREDRQNFLLSHGKSGQVNADNKDETRGMETEAGGDDTPAWLRARGLRKIASGALALQMLIAIAGGQSISIRHSSQPLAIVHSSRGGQSGRGELSGQSSSRQSPVVYGAPLSLAAMAHAPTNEAGVLFLFGALAERLGFRIERVQTGFPDCEAKRQVRPGVWKQSKVELEYESRNFKEHGHDPKGCDVIVCWVHNWPECPPGIEVIELSQYV